MTSKEQDSPKIPAEEAPPPYSDVTGYYAASSDMASGKDGYQQMIFATAPPTPPGQPIPEASSYHGYSQHAAPVTVVIAPSLSQPPPDHMLFNVLMTVCCCWPIGIFAILKSMECRNAINRGDRQRAEQYSHQARRLGLWTLGIGVIMCILSVVAIVLVYALLLIPRWKEFSDFSDK